ncbi:MAG: hypothetical protein P0S95_00620 [Rhabdochlamydiaceae bacterium]|nr:hypothetical protein [Candidatus Amphrikana amoebophyrae]
MAHFPSLKDRSVEMRDLVAAVQNAPDYYVITKSDFYHAKRTWFSYVPAIVYGFFSDRAAWAENNNLHNRMKVLFSERAVQTVFPKYDTDKVHQPLTVRQVKQLLVANAMVGEADMRAIHEMGINAEEGFSDGTPFESIEFRDLSDVHLKELYDLANPLTRKEVFCFGQDSFGPHSSGYGETHEGRERLVSAVMQIGERKFDLPEANRDAFFHTLLLRGIGQDTPIGTVYKTPYGVYKINRALRATGCKIVFLTPMANDRSSPPLVIFLPTQITPFSFRQNLEPCIGVDAVVDVHDAFVSTCNELGISRENRANFYGYSLGGIQLWLMLVLHIDWVDNYFVIHNPGLPKTWQKVIAQNLPQICEEKRRGLLKLQGRVIHTKGDGITNFGGDQIWAAFKELDRFPLGMTYLLLSPSKLESEGTVKEQLYSRGNVLDVMKMMVRSFYSEHCRTLFLEKSRVVQSYTNETAEKLQLLLAQSERTKLGIEPVRLLLVSYMDWIRNWINRTRSTLGEELPMTYKRLLMSIHPTGNWKGIKLPKQPEEVRPPHVPIHA